MFKLLWVCVCACANGCEGDQQGVAGSDPHLHLTVTRERQIAWSQAPTSSSASPVVPLEPLHISNNCSMQASLLLTCVPPRRAQAMSKISQRFLFDDHKHRPLWQKVQRVFWGLACSREETKVNIPSSLAIKRKTSGMGY